MKKLTTEELLNLTDQRAWEVAGTFADYLEKGSKKMLEFDDVLEYDREHILMCLLHLLKQYSNNKKAFDVISDNIFLLCINFIPNPLDYQKQLERKKIFDNIAR